MSSESTDTVYSFTFSLIAPNQGGNSVSFSLSATQTGVTDAIALAIAEAFQNQAWPSGNMNQFDVGKGTITTTSYEGDISTSPGSFS